MRLGSIVLFVALCSLTAYYIYEPIPEKIEERWKLMLTNSFFRSLSHLVRRKKKTHFWADCLLAAVIVTLCLSKYVFLKSQIQS